MSLVITIIVVIILAMIAIPATSRMPDEANYANFVEEIKNLEEGVQQTRLNNAAKGDTEEKINLGFKKVTLIDAPSEFQSFDSTGLTVTGYLVDLNLIKYENTEFGHDYTKVPDVELPELTFKEDDVYVYDSTGLVYYVKGTHYQEEIIHRPFEDSLSNLGSTEDGPIISNIVITSGELADGTKTSSKAKIIISAFPRYGGDLTVMVRELIAEEQPDGTFTTQVSRNGVYTVLVTEENGGRTVRRINVTGIIESNLTPSNLSMIVNNGNPNVTTNMVNIVLRADGAEKMIIAKNNPLKPTSSDERWEDYNTNFMYDLGTEEGRITLYAWFKNEYSNVTDKIVKASIIYDKTPPSTNAPSLTVSGPYIIVDSNQRDNISPDTYLLSKTEYGYRIHDGVLPTEDQFDWNVGKLIGPLQNGETYDFATRTEDEVGHKSFSQISSQKIKFDYLINFDLNGAIGSVESVYTEAGTAIIVSAPSVVRDGYTFVGWSEKQNALPTDVADIIYDGESYLPTGNDTTKTLYAVWAPRTDMSYTVNHYVEKAGSLGEYELKLTETLNDGKVGDLAWAVHKTDGVFKGYVENLSHSQSVTMAEVKGDGSTVLNLYYNRAKYDLIVKGENATTTGTMVEVPYETEVTITANPNQGYEFDRWVIEGEEEGSLEYNNFVNENGRQNQNAIFKMPADNITLIAKTKLKKYSITYNLNGGTATGVNPTEYDKNTPAFTLYNPIKTGYNFAGWSGTDLIENTMNVTINPATLVNMVDREYEALFTPSEDLLTITATPTEPTNGTVRAIIACLDGDLRVEYRVGSNGTWDMYASSIAVEENTVIYARALKDGIVVDEESLAINNIDKEPPVIEDISVSDNWRTGNKLLVKVTATDNNVIYGYAVSNSEAVPDKDEFKTSNDDLRLDNELNYIWVMDVAGNATYQKVYAWDISKNKDKEIYALLKNDTEMIIDGTGETASYESDKVPYVIYKENITSVTIEEGIETIGSNILSDMENAREISIPKSLEELKENAITHTNNYETIVIASGNTSFSYKDYTLYDYDKTEIYAHSRIDPEEEYIVETTVTTIKSDAFYENDNISKVVVTSNPVLENNAFENCSELYQIEGKIGGTTIEEEVFLNCENLHLINISDSLTTIGAAAFSNTHKLGVLEIPKTVTTVVNTDTSVKGVFEHIGIYSESIYNQGVVRYYQSCDAMYDYAHKYSTEANFEMIDDIPPEAISLEITSPVSGTYAQGDEIEFTAKFTENLGIAEDYIAPALKVKIGEEEKNIENAIVSGDKIVYSYIVQPADFGKVEFVSYSGKIYDLANNESNITITEMGGYDITINTVVQLNEGNEVSYYSSIQKALDAMKTSDSVINLLKDTDESITIKSNTTVSLNLNSNIFNNTTENIAITNKGTLDIFDGKITSLKTLIINTNNADINLFNVELDSLGENEVGIISESLAKVGLYKSTITGKSMLINMSDELEIINSTLTTTNGPAIKMGVSSSGDISSSTISVANGYGINTFANSKLEITDSSVTSTTGTAINNEGTINIYGTSTIEGAIGINSVGTVNFYDGTIKGTSVDSATVENSGTFEIDNGRIESSTGIAVQNRTGSFKATNSTIETTATNKDAVKNASGATFEFGSGDIISKDGYALVNLGTVTLKENSNVTSNGTGAIDNRASLTVINAHITSNGASSTAIVNTGIYEDTNSTVISKGSKGIENKTTGTISLTGTTIDVDNTNAVTGIATSSTREVILTNVTMTVDSTSGISTGIKLEQNSNVNVQDSTITATSGTTTGYGVNNYKGTLTLGVNNVEISKTLPSIEGTTYGYYGTEGTLNYYDGKFIGEEEKAIVGTVTDQPADSFVIFNMVGNREHSELTYDNWPPTDVTLVADKTEWTNQTIVLTGSAKDQGSGIAKYAITKSETMPSNAEWIKVSPAVEEFTVTKDIEEYGVYYLHVMDASMNYEISNSVEAKYDAEPPEIISITPDPIGWSNSDVDINVEVRDDISGVVGYEFTDTYHDLTSKGASYTTTAPVKVGIITHTTNENGTLHIYMYDQAGNVAYESYTVDNVDSTAPEVDVEFVEYGEDYVKVKITAKDEDSGIKDIIVDGETKTTEGTDEEKYVIIDITKEGTTEVEVEDNINNETIVNIETYLIVYNSVNATGSMPSQIKLKDQPIEILENRFVKEGYTFINWNTSSSYTGTEYNGGDSYTANASTTLYANWKDTSAPIINDVYLSTNWVAGNDVKLKIDATDNIAVTGYQITTTNAEPTSWSSSSEITIALGNETYYVWAKDDTGNVTSTEIKVYDLSKSTSPKTVVGILKDIEADGEYTLSIEGKGATKDLTSTENKPWETYIDSITKVDVKDGVTGIGEYVLGDLVNADEIKISSTVTDIALNSFVHTNNYSTLTVDGTNYKVSQGMLMDSSNKNVYVASTVLTTGDIVLPATVENIGPYAFENSTITSIYIAKNIDIQEGTFYNAKNLKDIISDTQIGGKSIGNSAFEGCSSLQYVTLSEDLEKIGARAFYGTTKLTNITIGKKVTSIVGNQVFTNIGTEAGTDTGKGYVYYYDSNATMSSYAQSAITKDQATFVGIDDVLPVVSAVDINNGAEITNNNEVKVKVTATDNRAVTGIFITADASIDPRTQIVTWVTPANEYTYTLPEETKDYTLYVWAKDAAGNISEVPGSDSITLAVYDFELNTETDVIQYVDTTGKDYYAYRETGYTLDNEDVSVEITGTVNHKVAGNYNIDYKLSYDGKYIETVTKTVHVIPNTWNTSKTTDGNFVFVTHTTGKYAKIVEYTNSSNETTLTIPETLTYNGQEYKVIDVGNNTTAIVNSDTTVQKVVLANNMIAVSDYAFNTFKNISSIEYSDNLMTIGAYAFANSNGIYSNVTINDNVREVKYGAFENTIIDEITIESGVRSIQEKAFYTQRGAFNDKTLTIPDSIDYIGMGAFSGYKASKIVVDSANEKYTSIEDLVLTDKAKTVIWQYAIGNGRTEYTVPAGINNIAGYSFSQSDNLQKVVLDSSTITIGEKAFKNDANLKAIENTEQVIVIANEAFMNTGLESFVISTNLDQIHAKAFKNTKLENVYIPSSVIMIENEAFASNTKLKYVVVDVAPNMSGDAFKNSDNLEYLVALDENTKIIVNGDLELPTQATLYVTSKAIEATYESDSKWSSLGIYRIKCLAELIGNAEISTEDKEVYTELGIKLLEEEIPTGTGTSSAIPELTVECVSDVNNEIAGEYHVTYYVKYNGNVEMTLVRTVKVLDDKAPVIVDTIVSDSWVKGSDLKLDVIAIDNKDDILSYAITTTPAVPTGTWTNNITVTLTEGENYIHVKDKAGNVTTALVKAWDISKNTDKTVFAYLKEDGELVVTGNGMTKDYSSYEETPWKDDVEDITKLTINEGITYAGEYVFSYLENVTEISIPSTLGNTVDMATSAFAGTTNFTTLTLADGNVGLKLDGKYTLLDDESKTIYLHGRRDPSTTYTISSNKELIAEGAFYKNNNLKSIDMNALVNIEDSAFEGCLNLESINGEIGNEKIDSAAFSGDINLKDIYISPTVTDLGTGIFTNVPGPVYYYASCPAMKEYATTYADETLFIMIDNVGASDTMPTLKASSSIIMATCNQVDEDGEIVKVEYNIRENGKDYDENKWQTLEYFTGLIAGTKYYVKTRATDTGDNIVESKEASITTKQVPNSINIEAVPAGPTSGDVDVVIEWPVADMEALYGAGWPAGTTVTKQVGIKNPSDSEATWSNIEDDNPTYTHTATENGVVVYARLFDGKNYTAQTISLSVGNIDRIAPTGSVVINDGDADVYEDTVTLTLSATDNRNDTGFGVKYYYASENPTLDLTTAEWKPYSDGNQYMFKFTEETGDKTVYVWYQDAAGNISDVCSDSIYMILQNVKLEQDGVATYYDRLQDAIDASNDNPTTPSKITILQSLSQDGPYEIIESKNIVIDMNGCNITQTEENGFELIRNVGMLTIMNSENDISTIQAIGNGGTVIGIENYGYLEIIDVSVVADSPDGSSIGIYNANEEVPDRVTYNIIYILDGGTLTSGNPSTYVENTEVIISGIPTKEGYTFTGWTGSNGIVPETPVVISKGARGDKTYIANWSANTYSVRYNANGGSGTMENSSHIYGVDSTLTANTFTRTGYSFKGWATTSSGSVAYADGATVSTLTTTNNGIVDLYAVWEANNYTYDIVYKSSSGVSLGTGSITRAYGTTVTISAPEMTGYTTPALQNITWDSETKTITFTYEPTSYSITIDCNGGSGVSSTSYDIETPTFTLKTPTRSGYTFTGWTDINGVTQASVTIVKGSIGAKSYTANWEEYVAQAIYSATDDSLTFIKDSLKTVGGTFVDQNGKTKAVTARYDDIETFEYKTTFETEYPYTEETNVGWIEYGSVITSVVVEDNISPISTSGWFFYFDECNNFDIEKLNTSNVKDMSFMFAGCDVLTSIDVSKFDTKNVTNMAGMFYDNRELTSVGNLANWDTSKVTDMHSMFENCWVLPSLNISSWDTSNVTTTNAMFASCNDVVFDVSNWNTSSNTDMSSMFYSCYSITQLDLRKWDTSKVTDMTIMFGCCGVTNLNASGWDTSNVTSMHMMFYECTELETLNLTGWQTDNLQSLYRTFWNCNSLKSLDLSGWNVSKVTDMSETFLECISLTSVGNISNWNTSNVENMYMMFSGCESLGTLNLSKWDVKKVTSHDWFNYRAYNITPPNWVY